MNPDLFSEKFLFNHQLEMLSIYKQQENLYSYDLNNKKQIDDLLCALCSYVEEYVDPWDGEFVDGFNSIIRNTKAQRARFSPEDIIDPPNRLDPVLDADDDPFGLLD